MRDSHFQHQFGMNTWADVIGRQLIGPFELPPRLNGDMYSNFLRHNLKPLNLEPPRPRDLNLIEFCFWGYFKETVYSSDCHFISGLSHKLSNAEITIKANMSVGVTSDDAGETSPAQVDTSVLSGSWREVLPLRVEISLVEDAVFAGHEEIASAICWRYDKVLVPGSHRPSPCTGRLKYEGRAVLFAREITIQRLRGRRHVPYWRILELVSPLNPRPFDLVVGAFCCRVEPCCMLSLLPRQSERLYLFGFAESCSRFKMKSDWCNSQAFRTKRKVLACIHQLADPEKTSVAMKRKKKQSYPR
ncbi:hypothetical protein PR048_016552 [Dryococelus australis]|uniref:Uncharacterized protein n=1 Tax=Dryococelus australis TaxID=614101 RepID=A0ABQ9HKJ6_9NEOP|nr:hypothetical protein PR048_016552 [Dryococelus australis]